MLYEFNSHEEYLAWRARAEQVGPEQAERELAELES